MKLEQEQKLEVLELKSALAQNQAKLNVCLTEERDEMADLKLTEPGLCCSIKIRIWKFPQIYSSFW